VPPVARQWQDKFYWNHEKPFDHSPVRVFRSMVGPQYWLKVMKSKVELAGL
jgi:hypothetical protein